MSRPPNFFVAFDTQASLEQDAVGEEKWETAILFFFMALLQKMKRRKEKQQGKKDS